ncbi:MAG: hypothetical protein H6Q15_2096 [Bacteroidetes bacterium]|nr:hypothetical protein [Bacteroidota bacterium]
MKLFNNFLKRRKLTKLRKAIELADGYHELTGRKYFVLNYRGKLIIKSKIELKHLIKTNALKANMETLEGISLYITE